MTMDEKWSIDKLDGSNWTTWKFQMRHLLLAKELWGYVDGTEVLGEGATAQVRAEFQKKSQKAFSTIVMAICSSQLYLITSVEQPKDAWDALRNHFERDTLANKLMLKKQYFRTEMKEGTSVESHLKSMKELTDKLSAIGAPISEEDQVVTLLGSLPQSYSTLVTALEARVDDVSLSYVQQALIHEERKKNTEPGKYLVSGGESERQQSALVGKQEKKFRCYGCGEVGHFRRDCPKRKESHRAKPATEGSHSESESEECTGAFVVSAKTHETSEWMVDSGASSHMTCKQELLRDYKEFEKPEKVSLGDGRSVEAIGVGNIHLNMQFKVSDPKRCVMYRVLYVPKLACNLFSVRAAVSKGNVVKFAATKCWIRNSKRNLCGMGSLKDKMYLLNCEPILHEHVSVASEKENSTDLWHQRLGHLSESLIKEMVSNEPVTGVKIPKRAELSFCEGCVEGKMHRKPFKPVGEIRSKRKLQCVHSDVCGPMPTESIGGKKYFVTFIDDYSRCCSVYFIRHKSEVLDKFKEFEAATTTDSGEEVCVLRSDNGGEYVLLEFETYLKSRGIRHELTVPHSPQQNGVAERMNRTLMESARSMLAHAGLPDSYWAEAVATAAYLRNRTPTTSFEEKKTPYERWYGKKPNLSHLKVFGCIAYAHIPDSKRSKLDKKAEKLRFVGYSIQSKGYRLIDERTSKVFIRRDVIFNESDFGHQATGVVHKSSLDVDVNPLSEVRPENVPEVGRERERHYPERQRRVPVRFGLDEYADLACTKGLKESQINEPSSIEEAFASELGKEWKASANEEYQSLMENDTWDLVELPSGRKPIGCKWVFKAKRDKNGKVERFKARLVAKGYAQKYGINYEETFSPVVRFSSIRALLAFAVQNDMLIHQMDVVTAFLNGNLKEEIYMEQPPGYTQPGMENLVCKLKKSLYGLKQSPRCWNTAFREHMESIHFKQSGADPCIFIRTEETSITIVAV